MISILIFLSLFYSVLNDYDLSNGGYKRLREMSKGKEYIFYIRASKEEKLKI